MRLRPVVELLSVVVITVMFLSGAAASSVIDVIDGVCDLPVRLQRLGQLGSWQTKQPLRQSVPFAVESDDTLAWLYVPGGNGQINVSSVEFGAHKQKLKESLRELGPSMVFAEEDTTLTVTYEGEAFIFGENRAATHGARFTLIGGCLFSIIITKAGHGHRGDILALLDLVRLSI